MTLEFEPLATGTTVFASGIDLREPLGADVNRATLHRGGKSNLVKLRVLRRVGTVDNVRFLPNDAIAA